MLSFFFATLFPIKTNNDVPIELEWDTHYRGLPNINSPFFALTALTWKYTYQPQFYKNRVTIKLRHEIFVDKQNSWVKWEKIRDEQTRRNLLHHEQGHVNIQYILYLEADRVLKNRTYSVKDYKTQVSKLAHEISDYFNTMQNNYDDETEHGVNKKMQARWDKIIEDKIAEAKAAALADSRK